MRRFTFIEGEGLYVDNAEVPITDFDVMVTKIIVTEIMAADGEVGKKCSTYEIIAVTLAGKKLPARQVKKLNGIKFFDLWSEIVDAAMPNGVRRLLEIRLQQTAKEAEIKRNILLEFPGINHIEGTPVYAVGDQILRPKLSKDIKIELSMKMKRHIWRVEKDTTVITDGAVKNYIQVAPDCSVIIFYSIMLGAIKPFFVEAGYNPTICINLVGESGIGKTRMVKTMCSFTGNSSWFMASMLNDKKNDALLREQQAYGFTFVLEDYHPTTKAYDRERQLSLMNAILRDIESVPESPVLLMTSECLDGIYSTQDRMLQVHVQKIDNVILKKIEKEKTVLPTLAKQFVQNLLNNYHDVLNDIQTYYCELDVGGSYTRAELQGEILKMVAKLYQKYMGSCNYLSELSNALQKQTKRQKEYMHSLKSVNNEDDYVDLFCKVIGSETIYHICTEYEGEYEAKVDQIYLYKGEEIRLTKMALRHGLKKYCGYDQKGLVKKIVNALHENDLLVEDKDTTSKKFCGVRHLCVSNKALHNYLAVSSLKKSGEGNA